MSPILEARVIARRAAAQKRKETRSTTIRLAALFIGAVFAVVIAGLFLAKVMDRENARESTTAQARVDSYCADRTIADTADRLRRLSMDPETRLALQAQDAADAARCADARNGVQADSSVTIE